MRGDHSSCPALFISSPVFERFRRCILLPGEFRTLTFSDRVFNKHECSLSTRSKDLTKILRSLSGMYRSVKLDKDNDSSLIHIYM